MGSGLTVQHGYYEQEPIASTGSKIVAANRLSDLVGSAPMIRRYEVRDGAMKGWAFSDETRSADVWYTLHG